MSNLFSNEILTNIEIQNELLQFRICNQLCINSYNDKYLSIEEKSCLSNCFYKNKEFDDLILHIHEINK